MGTQPRPPYYEEFLAIWALLTADPAPRLTFDRWAAERAGITLAELAQEQHDERAAAWLLEGDEAFRGAR